MLLALSGYVLAGGRSLRMGRDKALLPLGGKALAERAVETLSAVCERVRVVGSQPELAAFAPAVKDDFVGSGPLAGIEAALRDSTDDWVMVLAVDLPFVPAGLLRAWAGRQMECAEARICWLEADGHPQPLVAMLRRTLLPKVQAALRAGEHRVMGFYEKTGAELEKETGVLAGKMLRRTVVMAAGGLMEGDGGEIAWTPGERELRLRGLWFSNLNTPEEFHAAEVRLNEADAGGAHRS